MNQHVHKTDRQPRTNFVRGYPSPYLVVSEQGYTKYYYSGTDLCESQAQSQTGLNYAEMKQSVHCNRVAARIGRGGLSHDTTFVIQNSSISNRASCLFDDCLSNIRETVFRDSENPVILTIDRTVFSEANTFRYDQVPLHLKVSMNVNVDKIRKTIGDLSNPVTPEDTATSAEPEVYFYHSDHLGSASWISGHSGQAVQHLQYLPFGEPFVDQHPAGYQERFTFTGKERDGETGYGYFGARYMDHELMTGWLSVDPMADKYPSISPYTYCAWNPIKLMDPDGREVGDYYSVTGRYLGWDGDFDNKVHIIDDKTTLAKDANGNVDASKVTPMVSTTYETLEATLDVFQRTKKNGGSVEESAAVLAGLISRPGEQGYTGSDVNPHCNFPSITEGEYGLGVTSIHSHPFTQVGEDGYHPLNPSADDKGLFSMCDLNIIVGNITIPTTRSIYPNSTDIIGAAFFTSAGKEITTMNMRSIERVVNNRHKATDQHWNQIMKGL